MERRNQTDLRVTWLTSRDEKSRSDVTKLNRTQARSLYLENSSTAFALMGDLPNARRQVAQVAADLVRAQASIERGDRNLILDLRDQIKNGFPDQARSLNDALKSDEQRNWFQRTLVFGCAHAAFWLLLIFVYPHSLMVQAIFFWNKWIRRMFGLGYVGLAITLIPLFRRRLFEPFRESLIPLQFVEGFNTASYFDQSEVTEETKGNQPAKRQSLRDAIGKVKGQIVLKGQSGLGKTLLLQQLASKSTRTLVFLRATDCTNGVVAAIQRRLQGQAQDETYLRTLIFAGALDVLIDGLNEASPEARSRISSSRSTSRATLCWRPSHCSGRLQRPPVFISFCHCGRTKFASLWQSSGVPCNLPRR